jgi:anti-sigma regulatory factor (Ser/Thr protein kinase)
VSIDRLAAPRPGCSFRHEAFLYGGRDELVAGVTAFVRDGLAHGDSVLVALAADKVEKLRAQLGHDWGRVYVSDRVAARQNPARVIPELHDFVDEYGGGDKGLRAVTEPIGPVAGSGGHAPGSHASHAAAALEESLRHECLMNLAFESVPSLWVLCPYDVSALGAGVIDEVRRTHPYLLEHGAHYPSAAFRGGIDTGRLTMTEPLPDPPRSAVSMDFELHRLRTLRAFVALHAVEAGMDLERTADLVLAVNELGANSVQHASGRGTVRMWREADQLVCQVDDDGYITDPLVGLQTPSTFDDASRGLWVVNQLCDLVQIRSRPDIGTRVRVHMWLRPVTGAAPA